MNGTSWVEICVSNFEQSIAWFENVLGFRAVRREADQFAELLLGETSILVAADDAPYWEDERPRLMPAGQRGSGVEIVLVVENIDAIYRQAQEAGADIVRELADHPWHMRQFWVRHPDGYLIRPAEKILTVNQSAYYSQVSAAFRKNVPLIVDALAEVMQTAERVAQQHDYLGAATIYETLVTEIFEESHLYYDEEEEESDDYYNDYYYDEEPSYPEEEGLEEFVGGCIETLGSYLADERTDEEAREKCIEVLFDIYHQDVFPSETHGFAASAAAQLVRYARPLERAALAEDVRTSLTKAGGTLRQAYARFLLDLQKDTMSDEEYLQICRENELTTYLIDRLLTIGRIDEAVKEMQPVGDDKFLELADLFIQHKQDSVIEDLMRARIKEKPRVRILGWLRNYYRVRGNLTAELEMIERLLHIQPILKTYQELRDLATQLDYWQTVRPALLASLEESKQSRLLIEIALDEGDVDHALVLLKGIEKKDSHGTTYETGSYDYYGEIGIDLKVAQAAKTTHPHESIAVYQNRAERIIALRNRKSYGQACRYLVQVRSLYEKIGEHEAWVGYIAKVRELTRRLPAMREEMVKAKL